MTAAVDLLPGVGEAAGFVLKIAAGGGTELDGVAFGDFLVTAGVGSGWVVVGYADGYVGVAAFAASVGYCELEDEVGGTFDVGCSERGLGYLVVAERYGETAVVYLLPGVGEAAVFGVAATRAVELDDLVLVDYGVGASFGFGWVVVGYADGYVGVAAFAEAVGYCELEDEVGVGCDWVGCGERWGGGVGVAEGNGIAAAVDLLPGVGEAAVFVLKIAASGAVELDAIALVDLGVGASVGAGWAVVAYGYGLVGVAAFA